MSKQINETFVKQVQEALLKVGISTEVTDLNGRYLFSLEGSHRVTLGQQTVLVYVEVDGSPDIIKFPRIYNTGKNLRHRYLKMPATINKVVKILVERLGQGA